MENLGLTPSNCYVTNPATKDLRCRADHYIGKACLRAGIRLRPVAQNVIYPN